MIPDFKIVAGTVVTLGPIALAINIKIVPRKEPGLILLNVLYKKFLYYGGEANYDLGRS